MIAAGILKCAFSTKESSMTISFLEENEVFPKQAQGARFPKDYLRTSWKRVSGNKLLTHF